MLFTEDIYKIARADKAARFKRKRNGDIYQFNLGGALVNENRISEFILSPLIDEQWEQVRPQISFTDAMNGSRKTRPAGTERKLQEPDFWMKAITLKLEWINGLWEVE